MSYSTWPPKPAADKALSHWLSGYQPENNRIVPVNIDGQEVSALLITPGLASKIELALCLGRTYRLLSFNAIHQKKEVDSEITANASTLETLEFQRNVMKRTIEQNGDEDLLDDLGQINHEIHDRRAMTAAWEEDKRKTDTGVNNAKKEWKAAWAAVEEVLDLVWIGAGIMKPHNQTIEGGSDGNGGGNSSSNSSTDSGGNGGGNGGRNNGGNDANGDGNGRTIPHAPDPNAEDSHNYGYSDNSSDEDKTSSSEKEFGFEFKRSRGPAAGPSNVPAAGPSNVPTAGPSNVPTAGPSNVPTTPSKHNTPTSAQKPQPISSSTETPTSAQKPQPISSSTNTPTSAQKPKPASSSTKAPTSSPPEKPSQEDEFPADDTLFDSLFEDGEQNSQSEGQSKRKRDDEPRRRKRAKKFESESPSEKESEEEEL